jgi:hypothetical protein
MWFMANHCDELKNGNITESTITDYASDPDAQFMIRRDVNAETCRASRLVNAYTAYSGDTKKWDDWLESFDPTVTETTAEPELEVGSFTTAVAISLTLAVLAWK